MENERWLVSDRHPPHGPNRSALVPAHHAQGGHVNPRDRMPLHQNPTTADPAFNGAGITWSIRDDAPEGRAQSQAVMPVMGNKVALGAWCVPLDTDPRLRPAAPIPKRDQIKTPVGMTRAW